MFFAARLVISVRLSVLGLRSACLFVMTREEVKAVLGHLDGYKWIMASLMYGAGLRISECLRLRVQDLDFAANQIIVRDGKGSKDRLTMFPAVTQVPLRQHLEIVRETHRRDLADGFGNVVMPNALARKYPTAASHWLWQWVFPQKGR